MTTTNKTFTNRYTGEPEAVELTAVSTRKAKEIVKMVGEAYDIGCDETLNFIYSGPFFRAVGTARIWAVSPEMFDEFMEWVQGRSLAPEYIYRIALEAGSSLSPDCSVGFDRHGVFFST